MNQQDIDTLQIAIGSSERFNEDASTPAAIDHSVTVTSLNPSLMIPMMTPPPTPPTGNHLPIEQW